MPTKKYCDAISYRRVAFVVDDVLPPWKSHMIGIFGTVERLPEGRKAIVEGFSPEILPVTLTRIISFGLNDDVIRQAGDRWSRIVMLDE